MAGTMRRPLASLAIATTLLAALATLAASPVAVAADDWAQHCGHRDDTTADASYCAIDYYDRGDCDGADGEAKGHAWVEARSGNTLARVDVVAFCHKSSTGEYREWTAFVTYGPPGNTDDAGVAWRDYGTDCVYAIDEPSGSQQIRCVAARPPSAELLP